MRILQNPLCEHFFSPDFISTKIHANNVRGQKIYFCDDRLRIYPCHEGIGHWQPYTGMVTKFMTFINSIVNKIVKQLQKHFTSFSDNNITSPLET